MNNITGRVRLDTETRRRARAAIGPPPKTRFIPDKRKRPPKHKKLGESH